MVILPFSLGIGRADLLLFRRYDMINSTALYEERKKMTMVITLSFLELEGQTPSSLEDDGIGHGHLHNSSLRKGGRWPWSSFPSP